MTALRLFFYVAYIALGCVIVVRMLGAGVSMAILPGLVLGTLLIVLGAYRIRLFLGMRQRQR